jgi:Co/Zn/Cd efflux system component
VERKMALPIGHAVGTRRESDGRAMPEDSTRTVVMALGAGIGVTLAKVGAAVFTGSTALAAEAAHSLADNANDLSLFIAQRRSSRPPDDQHPLEYGRKAYFWALIAALGVFVVGAPFSLREGITELIHQRHRPPEQPVLASAARQDGRSALDTDRRHCARSPRPSSSLSVAPSIDEPRGRVSSGPV